MRLFPTISRTAFFFIVFLLLQGGLLLQPAAPGEEPQAEQKPQPKGKPFNPWDEYLDESGRSRSLPRDKDTTVTPPEKIPSFLGDLRSPYADVREKAVFALARAGDAAIEPLRQGLDDKDARYKALCIDLLALLGDKASLPLLVRFAAEGTGPALLQRSALRAVDILDPERTELEKMLQGESKAQAGIVLESLKAAQPDETLKADLLEYQYPLKPQNNLALFGAKKPNEAVEETLLTQINRHLEEGKVSAALRVAQEILDKPSESLAYISYTSDVEHLAIWHANADVLRPVILGHLEKYREMFDDTAGRELASVLDRAECAEIVNFLYRYGLTSHAPTAFGVLLEQYFEQARYGEFLWMWKRFADIQDDAAANVLVMTALSYCRCGRPDDARAMLENILARPDGKEIMIEGNKMEMAVFLAKEIEKASLGFRQAPADSFDGYARTMVNVKLGGFEPRAADWARHAGVFYGIGAVHFCRDAQGKEVKLFSWEIPGGPDKIAEFLKDRGLTREGGMTGLARGGAKPVEPSPYRAVVYGERVIVNSGDCVYCYRLSDGGLLWKYDSGLGAVELEEGFVANTLRGTKFPHAIVVKEKNAVYVVIEDRRLFKVNSESRKIGGRPPATGPANALVCLDLETGAERWSTANEKDMMRNAWFRSAPHYVDGAILMTVSAGFNLMEKIDLAYVSLLAVDADTGRLKWRMPVNAWLGWGDAKRDDMGDVRRCPAVLPPSAAAAGDNIFFLTNAGTLVMMNAQDGQILWIAQYPEPWEMPWISLSNRLNANNQGLFEKYQLSLPPVIWQDTVYIMPADSEYFMAYDMFGRMLWRVRVGQTFFRKGAWIPFDYLIARSFDQFLVGPDGTVYLLGNGIEAYDRNGVLLWKNSDIGAAGNALLARDCIVAPVVGKDMYDAALALVDPKTGKTIKRFELDLGALMKDHYTRLASAGISEKKEEREEAFQELLRFGNDAVAAVMACRDAEADQKRKEALSELAERLDRMDKGLQRHFTKAAWCPSLSLVKGRLLLTTKDGVVIAFPCPE